MVKIVFRGHGPYVGTDYAILEEFEDMPSENYLNDAAWDYCCEEALQWGEMFEGDEEDYDPDNSDHFLTSEICGYWEIYDAEKHDDLLN